jgi:hypothetical protein
MPNDPHFSAAGHEALVGWLHGHLRVDAATGVSPASSRTRS